MHRFIRNDFQRDAGESLPKFLAAVFAKKCGNRRTCGNRETLLRTGSLAHAGDQRGADFKRNGFRIEHFARALAVGAGRLQRVRKVCAELLTRQLNKSEFRHAEYHRTHPVTAQCFA